MTDTQLHQRQFNAIDYSKGLVQKLLQIYLKNPSLYRYIHNKDFSGCKVVQEFPSDSAHFPIISINSGSGESQFVDIQSSNFMQEMFDIETGEHLATRYAGANRVSVAVEISTISQQERQELVDVAAAFFTIQYREVFNQHNIQITGVRFNGDSEEAQDQEPAFVYKHSIGLELWVDWYLDVPVTETINKVDVFNQGLCGC